MMYDRFKAELRRRDYEAKIDRSSDEFIQREFVGRKVRDEILSYWQSRNGKHGHIERRAP